jgi:HEAT repeat protein
VTNVPVGVTGPEETLDPAVVEALMQSITKGMRAFHLYLPNNPMYQQSVESVRAAFGPVWKETSELQLDVLETEFRWDERVVLSQPNKSESLAWVLYKDGVRSVTLTEGVEETEIVSLLGVLQKTRNLAPDAEDDLLTLLWEQDFQHVRYRFVELATGEEARGATIAEHEPTISADKLQDDARAAMTTAASEGEAGEGGAATEAGLPTGIVNLAEFDSTLYFLDDADVEHLKGEIDREYQQDLRGNILLILLDLLELQSFSTVRAELISILDNFIPYLLAVGDFRAVTLVVREARIVIQRARELLPEHRKHLEDLPARLSQPDALAQLLQSLDEAAVQPSNEELGELFRELKPEAIETVIAWLPRLTNPLLRDLLYGALQRLAAAHPQELAKVLNAKDEAVLLEAIRLVSQLKILTVVPGLSGLLASPKRTVRSAALDALAAIGSPAAMQSLERAIDDADKGLRIAAVRVLSGQKHRAALPKIEAAVMGKALRDADLTEKSVFFEAYGTLVGPAGVKPLSEMLGGKGGFMKRKEDPETRACVAMALGKIRTPDARALLEQALAEKDPLVKNAINKALREFET